MLSLIPQIPVLQVSLSVACTCVRTVLDDDVSHLLPPNNVATSVNTIGVLQLTSECRKSHSNRLTNTACVHSAVPIELPNGQTVGDFGAML